MKDFFKTIKNIWSVEELKKRIIYTLLLVLVYRIGSYIVIPGIDTEQLMAGNDSNEGILGLINIFAGGAFGRASIMTLRYYALYFCIHCDAIIRNGCSSSSKNAKRG